MIPTPSPVPIPGADQTVMTILNWIQWSFIVAAIGAFIIAVTVAILRALGHTKAEGAKTLIVICVFILIGASAVSIITALLGQ